MQAEALKAGFSSQLLAAGLPQWAVYLALCSTSPPGSQEQQNSDPQVQQDPAASEAQGPPAQQLSSSQVKELLRASAPSWAVDQAVQAFLQRLQVPAIWLAGSLALWAQHRLDALGERPLLSST